MTELKWHDGGTNLFCGSEVRRLQHELTALRIPMQTLCKYAEMMCPPDGTTPAWKRKKIVINYLRKQNREAIERQRRLGLL